MKQQELNNKTKTELVHMLNELRGKLLQYRFDLADKKLKDNSQVGKTRRDIARILTRLAETPASLAESGRAKRAALRK